MSFISNYQYYENGGNAPTDANWGSYQYVSLPDIVNNFMLMYSGNNSLVNNEHRYKVLFHAKRAVQELNYDAFKEIKVLELKVCSDLRFILPHDYVNWVRISVYKDGVLRPLNENIQTNYSNSYQQGNDCSLLFNAYGDIMPANSTIDQDRLAGTKKSIYLNGSSQFNGMEGYCLDGEWFFDCSIGSRFGLNTETANINPTFKIDNKSGVINFSSGMADERCILEYVSDGMEKLASNGTSYYDDSKVTVNKMFEEYVYAYIEYAITNSKLNVQEYIVNRLRKRKTALFRNAKIRLSNIHPSRLLMNMRGQNKWLK